MRSSDEPSISLRPLAAAAAAFLFHVEYWHLFECHDDPSACRAPHGPAVGDVRIRNFNARRGTYAGTRGISREILVIFCGTVPSVAGQMHNETPQGLTSSARGRMMTTVAGAELNMTSDSKHEDAV